MNEFTSNRDHSDLTSEQINNNNDNNLSRNIQFLPSSQQRQQQNVQSFLNYQNIIPISTATTISSGDNMLNNNNNNNNNNNDNNDFLPSHHNFNENSSDDSAKHYYHQNQNQTLSYPNANIVVRANTAANVADGGNAKYLVTPTSSSNGSLALPNNINPSSYERDNISRFLTHIEERIVQIERSRNFENNNLSQNSTFYNKGHHNCNSNSNSDSNDDVYVILGKLFARVERLAVRVERSETALINIERKLNKLCFNRN